MKVTGGRLGGMWVCLVLMALVLVPGHEVLAEDGQAALVEPPTLEEGRYEGRQAHHPTLARAIESVLSEPDMRRTTVGIHVEDVSDGTVLYSLNADRLMNPASNAKLLTAAAVLDVLGPSHTIVTDLRTDERNGSSIRNLYVKGGGEAFLLYRDVLSWASELKQQGVTSIDGDLIIDDEVFLGGSLPPGFDQRPSDAAWRPMIGALSVNFNAVGVRVEPGDTVGELAGVRLDPPNSHVRVTNRARTVRGSLASAHVEARAEGDGTRVIVTGTIGVNADSVTHRRRIDNPSAFAGSVIVDALELMGIEFGGAVRSGAMPAGTERLHRHESQPMIAALSAMNKWSQNFIAEQLLRLLGIEGDEPSTWEHARLRATEALMRNGMNGEGFTVFNGSGLYDGNEVTPRQLVSLLREMRHHRYAAEFLSSLAIAGIDGTLRHRLDDDVTRDNLRGKTGTLRDVCALSGYVQTVGGRTVAFSILFNDPPRQAWNYRSQQDEIARAIAGFDG
jgi:serine-type D-Ala-D-Ala carboxypeptidase/endopeptidase (penicillin-binding protein 4)